MVAHNINVPQIRIFIEELDVDSLGAACFIKATVFKNNVVRNLYYYIDVKPNPPDAKRIEHFSYELFEALEEEGNFSVGEFICEAPNLQFSGDEKGIMEALGAATLQLIDYISENE